MNIDRIEITENSVQLTIFPKEHKAIINDKDYLIKDEKINELFDIIKNWENEYIDNSYYDGNSYSIYIFHEGKVTKYIGKRAYPQNYEMFTNYIRSIYD